MPSSYALGEHFEKFIKHQVECGRYASASEVVRDALRLLEERDRQKQAALDAIRAEIEKGLGEGPGKPADKVFRRLERKYAGLASTER